MKHFNLTLMALLLSLISFAQAPASITGVASVCLGDTTTYFDDSTGGTWSSSNPPVATIDSVLGILTANTPGTSIITYTTTGGSVTTLVTVLPPLAPIAGSAAFCPGGTITLMDAETGGTWSVAGGPVTIDPVTGIVTGFGGGTGIIYYTVAAGCYTTTAVTVNTAPYPYDIVGGGGIACVGSAGLDISTDGSTPGVNYQLFNGGVPVGAVVPGSGLGLDFGSTATGGTYTVVGTYAGTGCSTTMTGSFTITPVAPPTVYAVTGGGAFCAGSPGLHIGLFSSDAGILYQLYNGLSSVGAAMSGSGSALDFGVITTGGVYTILAADPSSGCTSNMSGTATITVEPVPLIYTVSGGGSYCSGTAGLDITLSGSNTGISYQLYDGAVADGPPVSGTGSPLSFGLYTGGTYTVIATSPVGCTSHMTGSAVMIPIMLTPMVSIVTSPGGTICTGTSVSFGAAPTNGGTTPTYVWSVNGAFTSTGSAYSYVPSNGDAVKVVLTSSLPCASPDTATTTNSITVITPDITVSSSSICGGSDVFVDSGGVSYSWSPSTGLSCTTCDTVTVAPTSTIIYTITGVDAYGCIGTTTVTADGNRISGHITVTGSVGAIRVWLIQYSSVDSSLIAIDSTMACSDNGTPYYAFNDAPAGNYLVKADVLGSSPGSTGYVPTYGMSSLHWDAADGIIHGSGTDTMHINMLYGIIAAGPGFISGSILSGAGRDTYTNIPVPGMLVFLTDAVSGNAYTYTYTNSDGYYAFSGIVNNSYIVYPEFYHYYTTPAYVITLYEGHDTVVSVDFKQHTQYGTITPYIIPAQVSPLSNETGLNIYPNPTSGNLNILWNNQPVATANLVVTDVVGREVYSSALNISASSGQTQIDLSGLKNGIYLISVKSANINYSGKLMIQQ